MQINDILMQMTLQGMWQVQNLLASGKADNAAGKSSFQNMLEQRRSDAAGTSQQADGSQKTDVADSEPSAKPQDYEDAAPDEQALAMGQALLADPFVPVQTAPVVQTVPQTLTPVQSAVQTEAAAVTVPAAVQAGPDSVPQPADAQAQVQPVSVPAAGDAELTAPVTAADPSANADSLSGEDMAQTDTQSEPKAQIDSAPVVENWQAPLFRDVQSAPVRVGDATVDMTAPADEVRGALTRTLKQAVEQGDDYVQIRLTPENLGTVVAEFTRHPDGALHVVLRAENEQTARMLSDHASTLGMMLQDGVRGEVRVEVPHVPQEQTAWQNPDQGGGRQQQQQQQQQRTPRQEAETFLQQLRLGLVPNGTEAV